MTDENKRQGISDDEQALAKLLRMAGERPEIPLGIESRVYHRVQQEWQSSTKTPQADKVYKEVRRSWRLARLRAWFLPMGVAASAVLAVLLVSQPDAPPPQSVATVASVIAPTPTVDYTAGATIYAGDILETGSGQGLSLLLARNATLRIDEETRLQVDSADEFTLLSGRIYADSGQFIYRDGGLIIDTPHGVVRDVGTQFAVAAVDGILDVAVREGRVELSYGSEVTTARMGERLTVTQDQAPTVATLDTHGDYWNWIVGLTPEFDTSNKSLLDFLKWAARETGRQLQFESDDSRMFAMRTDIHGSISGLTPDEALEAVLSTTTLDYRIDLDKVVLTVANTP